MLRSRDATAAVADADANPLLAGLRTEADLVRAAGVFIRVREQVHERVDDRLAVDADLRQVVVELD